jgi:hypothetical protein
MPTIPADAHWLAAFDSIHYALAAERLFQGAGLWCELNPAPREVSSDCVLVLEFRESDRGAARSILAQPALRVRGIFAPGAAGYEKVKGMPEEEA